MTTVHVNGLIYHAVDRGAGPSLVLLHGFTGSSASWDDVMTRLADQQRVVAVDLIGHGASAAPGDLSRYVFDPVIDDLAALLRQLRIGPATWLGYSMGGRLALGFALRNPDRLESDSGERYARN